MGQNDEGNWEEPEFDFFDAQKQKLCDVLHQWHVAHRAVHDGDGYRVEFGRKGTAPYVRMNSETEGHQYGEWVGCGFCREPDDIITGMTVASVVLSAKSAQQADSWKRANMGWPED